MPAQRTHISPSVPKAMLEVYASVAELTDACCKEHLTGEYAQLCRQMIAALCRKRPSPLLSGSTNVWAATVVYVVGSVNFLFDKSQDPYMSSADIANAFGVGSSTIASKAAKLRQLLKVRPYDPKWCLPSKLDENPLVWMISVNGFILDARNAPRVIQEEAYRHGLIPFIPDAESAD